MKFVTILCCVIATTFLSSLTIFADIARPKPSPVTEPRVALRTTLTIEPDFKGYQARLQIRQSDLQQLRAALDSMPGDRSVASSITHGSTRTIVAGLLLFLSISFAGVWLARARSTSGVGRGQKTAAAILLVVVTLGAAAIITRGNVAPPTGYYSWRNLSKSLAEGNSTTGSLDVEIIPDGAASVSSMKLTIPLRKQGRSADEE